MGKIMCNGKSYSGSFDKAVNISYDNTNSELDSTNVQGAIDELSTSISYYDTDYTILSSLTWTASGNGMYYSNDIEPLVNDAKLILGCTIVTFTGLRPTDHILPMLAIDGKKIRFMSNVNTFITNASIVVRVIYKK